MRTCSVCGKQAKEGVWRRDAFVCAACRLTTDLAEHLVSELVSPGLFSGPDHEAGKTRIRYVLRSGTVDTSGDDVELIAKVGPRLMAVLRRESGKDRVVLRLTRPDGSEFQGEGHTSHQALERLQDALERHELRLKTCGNCACFRFSTMSYQMSDGNTGYCTIGRRSPQDCGHKDRVSIFDVCDAFSYGPEFARS